jgi:predicted Rossmann-fold nucleotide-binding protein
MLNKYKTMKTTEGDSVKMKVAIIGSRNYENRQKIREMIFKLKQSFGSQLEIVSGGAKNGADYYAKKYALELGVTYREFNPAFTTKNLYSAMPDSYYEKPYHVSQLFHRNSLIVKYADKVIAFRADGVSNGTDHVIGECVKHKKPYIIISENA